MLTRCPHCETTFRVTAEQLKTRHGQVRCGACHEVFDALESLVEEPLVALPPSPAAPAPVEMPAPTAEAEPPAATEAQEPVAAAAEAPLPPAWQAVQSLPPRRWWWAVGVVLLVLLALGQIVFALRTELAASSPELRPLLAAGCELLGCTVPRPRRPELLSIETSDLAPEGAGLLLTATLKNRAPFAQDYPVLELTLTDTQDQALVRKALAPADWLPADRPANAGFAAQGEVAVRLLFAADGVPAVGYRLYLFYP